MPFIPYERPSQFVRSPDLGEGLFSSLCLNCMHGVARMCDVEMIEKLEAEHVCGKEERLRIVYRNPKR